MSEITPLALTPKEKTRAIITFLVWSTVIFAIGFIAGQVI